MFFFTYLPFQTEIRLFFCILLNFLALTQLILVKFGQTKNQNFRYEITKKDKLEFFIHHS